MLRVGNQLVSAKTITRSREKSAFVKEVEEALQNGGFVYVSHQEWLNKVGEVSKATEKNGPRYTLKRLGYDCKAITLSGKDLDAVADAEGRDLSEKDIIYAIAKAE